MSGANSATSKVRVKRSGNDSSNDARDARRPGALVARSDLRIQTGDKAGAEADLDAANTAARKEDAVQ